VFNGILLRSITAFDLLVTTPGNQLQLLLNPHMGWEFANQFGSWTKFASSRQLGPLRVSLCR